MNPWHMAVVMASAFVAGMMNSVAGGGTLVSFPSLLWIGLDAKAANVTSTVALWPGSLGGFWGHRHDLAGTKRFALRLMPPSLLGGIAGAALLLWTPSKVFDALVPWLLLTATLLFAAKEPVARGIARVAGHERNARWWAGAICFQFLVGVYGGYFGAGIGILMLAALGLLGLSDIHQMNGLKNLLALLINGVAVVLFALKGNVVWIAAVVMAVAAILGGLVGAAVAHRLGKKMVNVVVIVIGLIVAAWFFLKH